MHEPWANVPVAKASVKFTPVFISLHTPIDGQTGSHNNSISTVPSYRPALGKLGHTATDFEVKQRKSARNRGIDHSEPEQTASHLVYFF